MMEVIQMPVRINGLSVESSPESRKLVLTIGMLVLLFGLTLLRTTAQYPLAPLAILVGVFWMCLGALSLRHG